MSTPLREQLMSLLCFIVPCPQMFGSPETSEGQIISLVEVLLTFHDNISMTLAFRKIGEECKSLTKDVEHDRSQAVLLCEESVSPNRHSSYERLTKNAQKLCINLLDIDPCLKENRQKYNWIDCD